VRAFVTPVDAIAVERLAADQLHVTHALRQEIDLNDARHEESDFQGRESLRDRCGVHLGFYADGVVIGAIRLVPMGRGITLLESVLARESVPDSSWRGSWEIGRLALLPEYRGISTLTKCLGETASWLHRNTDVESMFGLCSAALATIYTRFGFVVFKEIQRGPAKKRCALILGRLKEIVAYFEGRPLTNDGPEPRARAAEPFSGEAGRRGGLVEPRCAELPDCRDSSA
jgi:predicted GNAT family N-acyltransferase